MLAFTRCIVAGKYFCGSRVEITTCALGKVEEAFSITPVSAVATLSCFVLRSFVPVYITMWLGEPSWSSDRLSRACWVYGHQSLDTLCLGKSVFSFSHPPFSLSHLLPFFLPLHTLNSLLCLLYPSTADTPAQRVQFLLGTEDGDEEHIPHALFTELDEICLREGEDAEWKETAR